MADLHNPRSALQRHRTAPPTLLQNLLPRFRIVYPASETHLPTPGITTSSPPLTDSHIIMSGYAPCISIHRSLLTQHRQGSYWCHRCSKGFISQAALVAHNSSVHQGARMLMRIFHRV